MGQRARERLDEHQRAILAILDGGSTMLAQAPGDVGAIARARWALTRALTAYQHFKYREIFDPIIAGGSGLEPMRAQRLKSGCEGLGEDWRRHVQRWSAVDVAAHWAAYEPAAKAMNARLRSAIARDQVEVVTLLGE